MPSRIAFTLCLCALWSCGSSGTGTAPGPLVDNTLWVPTTDGDDLLGAPPPDAECMLEPIDCDEEYPWPEGECVDLDPTSDCVAAYVPECEQSLIVLSVNTRMPDDRMNLCNWITLEQPSLRPIRAGDQVEVRTFHDALTAPVPGEARMTFLFGDQIAFDYAAPIPSGPSFPSETWTADKDYPAGTQLLWHVDNHGRNEYMLIEVNVCDPATTDACL
ncbi:MAG: hypothetical protein JRJ10_15210 [Deltaproteobacteria bacterium]|nr:hypothetical protein [Deltaproteobacteria bacterium]